MSKRSSILVGASAFLILVMAGGFAYLRGGSTPVPLDEAVQRYRAPASQPAETRVTRAGDLPRTDDTTPTTLSSTTEDIGAQAQGAAARPLTPEGVYLYSTTGYDEVDVLGGNRHTYPDETTITVRHAGCGLTERWDALAERWDERESCPTDHGDVLRRVTSYHEFFRQGDTRTLRCNGYTYPLGAEPGDTWKGRCSTDTTMAKTTLTAVAWENVVVEGKKLRTLHVRADTVLSGEQNGESHRDVWGSSDNGLVLREKAMVRSKSVQPGIGAVTYSENYEIRLISMTPKT